MIEFVNEAFQLSNLPATGFLLLISFYWLMVVLGAIGMDAIDLDFDADVDVDIDGDFDTTAGGFSSFAEFMHLAHVPIVIVASVFALLFWAASFFGNHYLNSSGNTIIGLGLMSLNVPVCLVLTRMIIGPFAEGFKPQEVDKERKRMVGLIGEVTSSEVTPSFGVVSVRQNGPEMVINVRSEKDKPKLGKGDAAKIVAYDYENNTYLVELCKWED